jgi:UDP-N-acetylglucosamine 3-dehydrogenase
MIKVALVGEGDVAKKYAQLLSETGQVEIVGLYDEQEDRALELASIYGGLVFLSFADLNDVLPLSTLFVCVGPQNGWTRTVMLALGKGRTVITEMPAASRLLDVQAMLRAAKSSGGRLLFVNPERFYAHHIDIKKRIDAGTIGNIGVINVKRYSPVPPEGNDGSGSSVQRLAMYDIDVLRWIVGDITSVYAMQRGTGHVDYALVTLRFRSGEIANLEACLGYPETYTSAVEYAGTQGLLRYDNRKTDALHIYKKASPRKSGFSPSFRNPEYEELVYLLSCIQEGLQPVMTAEDALETLRVTAAAEQSIMTGQPVELIDNTFSLGIGGGEGA